MAARERHPGMDKEADMRVIAFIISLSFAALGAVGAVSPGSFLAVIRKFESPAGLSAAGALRVALGTSLYFSSLASRISGFLRYLGIVTFISGILTPFFGVKRFGRLIKWWSTRGHVFLRIWAVAALTMGLLLAWAVAPWIRREIGEQLKG
jgi:hypothetical protein